jgi:hypothetical protein
MMYTKVLFQNKVFYSFTILKNVKFICVMFHFWYICPFKLTNKIYNLFKIAQKCYIAFEEKIDGMIKSVYNQNLIETCGMRKSV